MKKNSAFVKQQNRIHVFRYLLNHVDCTKPEIALNLGLSIPTVGQIMTELMDENLVLLTGEQESNGGRRAMTFSLNVNCKNSLGINITQNHVEFILINLAHEVISHKKIKKPFYNDKLYLSEVYTLAKDFVQEKNINLEEVLGIGIAFPGIIKGNHCLAISHALKLEKPLILDDSIFPNCKVTFFNDSTAACMAELTGENAFENFIYISLSDTVGGACVIKRKLIYGDTNRNGEVGHICIRPGGKTCYCGKEGHYDAYGNAKLLKEKSDDGSVEGFLKKLKSGNDECLTFFDEYLDNLALIISNIHMFSDLPIVIGGYVGNILNDYLDIIRQKARALNIFPHSEEYIFLAKHSFQASAEGAARFYIEQFIEEL